MDANAARRLAAAQCRPSIYLLKTTVAAGGLLAAAVVALLAFLLWPSAAVDPHRRYLPDEFGVYTTLDVAGLLKSPVYRAMRGDGKGGLPPPARIDLFVLLEQCRFEAG